MQTRLTTLAMSAFAAASVIFMSACSSIPGFGSSNSVESANFGLTKGGEATEIYTLKNKNGLIAKVYSFPSSENLPFAIRLHTRPTVQPKY